MTEQDTVHGGATAEAEGMARFFSPANLARYRRLAGGPTTPLQRRQIIMALAHELDAFKAEMKEERRRPSDRH
jgi:hypothetical protein